MKIRPISTRAQLIICSLFFSIACVGIQSVPAIILISRRASVAFAYPNKYTARVDLSHLTAGKYDFLFIRPRSECAVTIDGYRVSPKGPYITNSKTILRATFLISNDQSKKDDTLILHCPGAEIFTAHWTSFENQLFILPNTDSLVWIYLHFFVLLVLGPMAAFFMTILALVGWILKEKSLGNREVLFFSIIALIYQIILSRHTLIVLNPSINKLIQSVSRGGLQIGFIVAFCRHPVFRKLATAFCLVAILYNITIYIFDPKIEDISYFYVVFLAYLPVAILLALMESLSVSWDPFVAIINCTWAFSHLFAAIAHFCHITSQFSAAFMVFICVAFIYQLISGRVEVAIRLVQQEAAVSLALEKGKVADRLAHDIRSPLSALNVLLNGKGILPSEGQELLAMVIHRINEIASDLLFLNSKRSRQVIPLQARAHQVEERLDEIILEKKALYRVMEISKHCFYERDIILYVDLIAVQRVISNILDNAAECYPAVSVKIVISSNQEGLTLSVEDDGPGITPEVLKQVGTPGFTHGKKGGNGIGLSSSIAILESWNGHLKIRSVLKKGTVIELFLKRIELEQNTII